MLLLIFVPMPIRCFAFSTPIRLPSTLTTRIVFAKAARAPSAIEIQRVLFEVGGAPSLIPVFCSTSFLLLVVSPCRCLRAQWSYRQFPWDQSKLCSTHQNA